MEVAVDYIKEYITWKWVVFGGFSIGILMLKRRMGGKKCPSKAIIPGKTVIITGANSGIGKATALELAKREARVILACRSLSSGTEAVKYIRKYTKKGELVVKPLDLASLKSIKLFSDDIIANEDHVDILVNNAGIYQCPFMKTEDGFEMQMGVNHLGHFYLTNLLLDKLKKSAPSRVVVVSSGHYKLGKLDFINLNGEIEYKPNMGYYNSKLANVLFSRELARKTDGSGVNVYCLRPGMVRTNLGRYQKFNPVILAMAQIPAWILVKSPFEGCQTVVYCCVAEEIADESGKMYSDCESIPYKDVALDDGVAKKLWEVSEKLTGFK